MKVKSYFYNLVGTVSKESYFSSSDEDFIEVQTVEFKEGKFLERTDQYLRKFWIEVIYTYPTSA